MAIQSILKVGIAQMEPIWLNRTSTTNKIVEIIRNKGKDIQLLVFPEAILPGYPFWLEHTGGANFNSGLQKSIFAAYCDQSVCIERGDLDPICIEAAKQNVNLYLGIVERPTDRGGHSLYCSLVFISSNGEIKSVHRKLQPTYEERLVWSPGDGNGLVVHENNDFKLGGLNCWENWMPAARTSLYYQGENVHTSVWPGSVRNTENITRFIAEESRSYVIACSGLLKKESVPHSFPEYKSIIDLLPEVMGNGGSAVAKPDGSWLLEPQLLEENTFIVELNLNDIYKERQNFDISGHYSRPDVIKLTLDKQRQSNLKEL